MKLKVYQVDAFASKVFEGNPAAVCPLDKWLDDEILQKIAEENDLSETAFFVFSKNDIQLQLHPLTQSDSYLILGFILIILTCFKYNHATAKKHTAISAI